MTIKGKIPPTRIPSDDCVVHVGQIIQDNDIVHEGTPYYPHQGEWVDVLPITTVGEVIAISSLSSMSSNSDAAQAMGEHFANLSRALSRRIVGWNWTDMVGDPLPQPYQRADVIASLTSEELVYLTGITGPQTDEMRKNGSEPSGNTSSQPMTTALPSP